MQQVIISLIFQTEIMAFSGRRILAVLSSAGSVLSGGGGGGGGKGTSWAYDTTRKSDFP